MTTEEKKGLDAVLRILGYFKPNTASLNYKNQKSTLEQQIQYNEEVVRELKGELESKRASTNEVIEISREKLLSFKKQILEIKNAESHCITSTSALDKNPHLSETEL